jgi:hypothetical protein
VCNDNYHDRSAIVIVASELGFLPKLTAEDLKDLGMVLGGTSPPGCSGQSLHRGKTDAAVRVSFSCVSSRAAAANSSGSKVRIWH